MKKNNWLREPGKAGRVQRCVLRCKLHAASMLCVVIVPMWCTILAQIPKPAHSVQHKRGQILSRKVLKYPVFNGLLSPQFCSQNSVVTLAAASLYSMEAIHTSVESYDGWLRTVLGKGGNPLNTPAVSNLMNYPPWTTDGMIEPYLIAVHPDQSSVFV